MHYIKFSCSFFICFIASNFLWAQEVIPPTQKVRVTYLLDNQKHKKYIGLVPRIEGQSLLLQEWSGTKTLQLDLDKIQSVHLYKRKRQGLGFLLGLGVGTALGYGLSRQGRSDCLPNTCDTATGFRTAGFTLGGALVGVVIGGVILPVRWERISVDALR